MPALPQAGTIPRPYALDRPMHTLFWLRTDLRAHDNPALAAAARRHGHSAVLAAPGQWKLHGDAPAKVDFWLRNLHALSGDLQALGIP